MFGSGLCVAGWRLCERFMSGNFTGSRTKKMGYHISANCSTPPKRNTNRVVKHPVKVTLVGIELHRPSTHITGGIRGARLTGHLRHTQQHVRFLADGVEEAGTGEVRAVMGHLEGAERTSSLGVDDTRAVSSGLETEQEIEKQKKKGV